ncbi:MAG: hypothetical protein AABW73_00185 [Nanoarchaeota archaeon]
MAAIHHRELRDIAGYFLDVLRPKGIIDTQTLEVFCKRHERLSASSSGGVQFGTDNHDEAGSTTYRATYHNPHTSSIIDLRVNSRSGTMCVVKTTYALQNYIPKKKRDPNDQNKWVDVVDRDGNTSRFRILDSSNGDFSLAFSELERLAR